MKKQYLLSIVIPTRNRSRYTLQAIKEILRVTSNKVQIVIQDNSDDNELGKNISNMAELNRIKYTFVTERISGVDNYAGGIKNADGEYICCIGDDDGVTSFIEQYVEWAKENSIEAIRYPNLVVYNWPGISKKSKGSLNISGISLDYYYFNPETDLQKLLDSGAQNYLELNLVKGYHGIVKKHYYDKIFEITGKYCGGLSPDIYLSVALSLLVESAVNIYVPLTIGGACRESTTGDSVNKTNFGPFELTPHIIGQKYSWSDIVPKFYSATTIWADSALHAFIDMKRVDLLSEYNMEKIFAECIVDFPQFMNEVGICQRNNNADIRLINKYKKEYFKKKKKIRLKEFFRFILPKRIFSRTYYKEGIVDINEAEKICDNYINGILQGIKMPEKRES